MSTRKYVGAPNQMEIKALMNFVIFQSFPVDDWVTESLDYY